MTGPPSTFLIPNAHSVQEAVVARIKPRSGNFEYGSFQKISEYHHPDLTPSFPPDFFTFLPIYFPPFLNQYGLAHTGIRGTQNRFLHKLCVIIPLSKKALRRALSNRKEVYNREPREYCASIMTVSSLLMISLSWNSVDVLDLSLIEPNGEKIYYDNQESRNGGKLTRDAKGFGNSTCAGNPHGSEGITYNNMRKNVKLRPLPGMYTVEVHHVNNCGLGATAFNVAVIIDGVLHKSINGHSDEDNGKRILRFKFILPTL